MRHGIPSSLLPRFLLVQDTFRHPLLRPSVVPSTLQASRSAVTGHQIPVGVQRASTKAAIRRANAETSAGSVVRASARLLRFVCAHGGAVGVGATRSLLLRASGAGLEAWDAGPEEVVVDVREASLPTGAGTGEGTRGGDSVLASREGDSVQAAAWTRAAAHPVVVHAALGAWRCAISYFLDQSECMDEGEGREAAVAACGGEELKQLVDLGLALATHALAPATSDAVRGETATSPSESPDGALSAQLPSPPATPPSGSTPVVLFAEEDAPMGTDSGRELAEAAAVASAAKDFAVLHLASLASEIQVDASPNLPHLAHLVAASPELPSLLVALESYPPEQSATSLVDTLPPTQTKDSSPSSLLEVLHGHDADGHSESPLGDPTWVRSEGIKIFLECFGAKKSTGFLGEGSLEGGENGQGGSHLDGAGETVVL